MQSQMVHAVGGPARARVIFLFGAVLALSSAEAATIGAVTATAGPAIASLTGDYFPARERGRVYGYILGGEVAGTAVGFIVSGSIAAALSWRWAFFAIAIPGFFLARTMLRTVPEPK